MGLIERLSKEGFLYIGTVRKNRLAKCELANENQLKKQGRGSHDFCVEETTNTVCVRWLYTKVVTLMSTYAGLKPMGKAQRWDKATKKYTDVDCPFIKEYNARMGGVDLLDAHIARCKPTIRSRRWYIILFWHFASVGMINSWLLYKRNCALHYITGASVLTLRRFQFFWFHRG